MLEWLRKYFKESGDGRPLTGRHPANAVLARFAGLMENQDIWLRTLSRVEDANTLAIKQMEIAQSTVGQLERQLESQERLTLPDSES
jgi:hypothetical protein